MASHTVNLIGEHRWVNAYLSKFGESQTLRILVATRVGKTDQYTPQSPDLMVHHT